jgi:nicotinamide riboside kinase
MSKETIRSILVLGPQGSGKTTLINSLIREINSTCNVWTEQNLSDIVRLVKTGAIDKISHIVETQLTTDEIPNSVLEQFEIYDLHHMSDFKKAVLIAKTKEAVNHPEHYGGEDNPYEVIKVIEAWGLDFHLGNTVKYIARAGKKDDITQELKKAIWYLERKLAKLEKRNVENKF